MKIIIEAEAKEIADLITAIQGRQENIFYEREHGDMPCENNDISQTIEDVSQKIDDVMAAFKSR